MSQPERRGTPGWVWALAGCGCLAIVVIAALVAVVGFGASWVKQTQETMSDPVKREAAALEALGIEALPAPWHPAAALSIPLLGDIVVLADHPVERSEPGQVRVDAGGGQMLALFSMRDLAGQRDKVRTALREGRDLRSVGIDSPLRVGSGEAFAKGSFGLGESDVTWAAFGGEFDYDQGERGDQGLVVVALVDCPSRPRVQVLAWGVSLDAGQPIPVDEAGIQPGTPGDGEALRGLLEQFPLCPP